MVEEVKPVTVRDEGAADGTVRIVQTKREDREHCEVYIPAVIVMAVVASTANTSLLSDAFTVIEYFVSSCKFISVYCSTLLAYITLELLKHVMFLVLK